MLLGGSMQTCSSFLLLWLLACGVGPWMACEASPVQNVRVHVYRPHRHSILISALILWDPASSSSATNYTVSVFTTEGHLITAVNTFGNQFVGLWNGPPFPVDANSAHLSLTFFGVFGFNYLVYPLGQNSNYSATVSYINGIGEMEESEKVYFSTQDLSPPLEVLATRPDLSSLVGKDLLVSMGDVVHPATVNTLDRQLFYYKSGTHSLQRSTLDLGTTEVVASLPTDLIPLALSYDWLGKTVYLAARNNTDRSSGIWNFKLQTLTLHPLYEMFLDDEAQVTMVVNPFTGYLYWTEYNVAGINVTLRQLNLRDNTAVIPRFSLTDHRVSPALALDAITDKLWVSDQSNGDILSCDISTGTMVCRVEVCTKQLLNFIPRVASLSIDELRIYWTIQNSSSVFYVLKSYNNSLLILNSSSCGSHLLGLSPGQQPWLAAEEKFAPYRNVAGEDACLSPYFGDINSDPNRPTVQLVNKTNSSISVNWTVPQLTNDCQASVFSYPPLHYLLYVRQDMVPLPGFPLTLIENQYTVIGLKPFEVYEFFVEAKNIFTSTLFGENYGLDKDFRTSEGVPTGKVENITSFPYGPGQVFITWDPIPTTPTDHLKGEQSNQVFFFDLESVTTNLTRVPYVDISTDLQPSTSYPFHVRASNGVFNSSTSSTMTNSTWPHPPLPQLISVTAESVVAVVSLSQVHQDIHQLHLELYPEGNLNETVTSAVVNCSGLPGASNSSQFEFNFTNLTSLGLFNLRSVATYRSVEVSHLGMTLGPITDTSDVVPLTIDVPDAPQLSILPDQLTLSWTVPDDNGVPVNRFFLLARNLAGMIQSVEQEALMTSNQTAQLLQVFSLEEGEEYRITVVASNDIGNSSESNPISFMAPSNSSSNAPVFDRPKIIAITVVGVVIAAAMVTLVIVIVCLYKRRSTSRKVKLSLEKPDSITTESECHKDPLPEKGSVIVFTRPNRLVHPISIPARYPEPGESLSPQSLSMSSPSECLLQKKTPPRPLTIDASLGSVYANSDTSTPLGPSPLHSNGSCQFGLGRVYTNPDPSTPDTSPNGTYEFGRQHSAEKSTICKSESKESVH